MSEVLDISTQSLLRALGYPSSSVGETSEVFDAATSLLDISSQDGKSAWRGLFVDEKPEEDSRLAKKLAMRKARNKQHAYNSRRRTAEKIERLTLENEALRGEIAFLREQMDVMAKTTQN